MIKPPTGRSDPSSRDLTMEDAGQKLKRARERLNLRYREVEEASLKIAARNKNDEFAIALSRLSDIENKGTVPSIYRIYSLCAIYRLDVSEVFEWYGINFGCIGGDAVSVEIEKTHTVGFNSNVEGEAVLPLALEPGIDLTKTVFLSRVIQRWGKLPLVLLNGFDLKGHRYGFVGTEDWSMYPVLQPGSLVLIDESRRKVLNSGWGHEFERPIYFIEHRTGYACGWLSVKADQIILQPHPASHCDPDVYLPDEVDIVGQVVGVAMRLDPPRRRRTRS
jgi:transcriptional regulator with XRE-family HTH domain